MAVALILSKQPLFMYSMLIAVFIIAGTVVYFTCHKLINIAFKKHLFDEPTESRKIHSTKTPSLGGAAIVLVFIVATLLFQNIEVLGNLRPILIASLLLFSVGIADDLVGMKAINKLSYQLMVALFTTWPGGIRIENMGGFLGIYEIDISVQIIITTFIIVFMINAINLIDGINCLAGGMGFLICCFLLISFLNTHQNWLSITTTILGGCIFGFILQNKTPAKIFMGDTGSMFLGYILSVLSVFYINLHIHSLQFTFSPIIICLSYFIVPVYDTTRVFIVRLSKRQSPFVADRNHMHHRLIDAGFTHMQSTALLLLFTIFCFVLISLLHNLNSLMGLSLLFIVCVIMDYFLKYYSMNKKNQEQLIQLELLKNKNSKKSKVIYLMKNRSIDKKVTENIPLN